MRSNEVKCQLDKDFWYWDFFFFHLTNKCGPHSTKWYRGKMSWEREPFCETWEWYWKISLHSKLSWKENWMQTFSCLSLYSSWHVQGRLRSMATADCCYHPSTKKTWSLPGATVSGEPVRGGVAGTFLGGSGGGAAKIRETKHHGSLSP